MFLNVTSQVCGVSLPYGLCVATHQVAGGVTELMGYTHNAPAYSFNKATNIVIPLTVILSARGWMRVTLKTTIPSSVK